MHTLKTKIFLDGGDPEETKSADTLLRQNGFAGVEGQTTNPSLIVKNLARRLGGRKVTESEALAEYRRIVTEISKVTSGPISVQVTGGPDMTRDEMLSQARERISWIPGAVIKFPCTGEGLRAASEFANAGPVNMTLVFSQEQAAAAYVATSKVAPHSAFVSPFVGRLDDLGINGMDAAANILKMYRAGGDSHIQVLTASVRNVDQFKYALYLGSDAVTVPLAVLEKWVSLGCPLPDDLFSYAPSGLSKIPYRELNLHQPLLSYDIHHELTDTGVMKFWNDWKSVQV